MANDSKPNAVTFASTPDRLRSPVSMSAISKVVVMRLYSVLCLAQGVTGRMNGHCCFACFGVKREVYWLPDKRHKLRPSMWLKSAV